MPPRDSAQAAARSLTALPSHTHWDRDAGQDIPAEPFLLPDSPCHLEMLNLTPGTCGWVLTLSRLFGIPGVVPASSLLHVPVVFLAVHQQVNEAASALLQAYLTLSHHPCLPRDFTFSLLTPLFHQELRFG